MASCRICSADVQPFLDLGRQPLSDAFRLPDDTSPEFTFDLVVGSCDSCRMVQLLHEVPRERMFRADYPFSTSTSARMSAHFRATADQFLRETLHGGDAFIIEVGCNDGTMLESIAAAGVRHLGVDPSSDVLAAARSRGVQTEAAFFEASTAKDIAAEHGLADVVYAANTICHIPYLDSVFEGLDHLLKPDGVFVFEDPYLGDVVAKTSFDQIYDEHFFLFSARSVQTAASVFGFELVDVERLGVHGGEVRYTVARSGARPPSVAVADLVAEEAARDLHAPATLDAFAAAVAANRDALVGLLRLLKQEGRTVVGYGATAKSATVTNYCGIDRDLVTFVCDTTPEKQGRVTPGAHIPVRPPEAFADPYPDYALLFAWNHADEIMAKESRFRDAGGRWIRYVPIVHVD